MSPVSFRQYIETKSHDISISEIDRYSVLNDVYLVWKKSAGDAAVPQAVDPLDLPRSALRHIMLVDLTEEPRDAVIRLAGTLPCELYGGELRNMSVHRFFAPADADRVLDDLFQVAATGEPRLTARSYVAINERFWAYTRLLLPLRPDGRAITRIMKLIEPASFQKSVEPGPSQY